MKACPGSGKTFTVAARLHRLVSQWRSPHAGVAAISFTNVAWQEIQDYLINDFGMECRLRYPHFLGTIDSFINQFIFLPFGHLVMGCDARPELTGPPFDQAEPVGTWLWWPKGAIECWRYCRLNSFSYDISGCLTVAGPDPYRHFGKCGRRHTECSRLKTHFNRTGHATQADANYFSMRVLLDHREIAVGLARRFPVMIVDEAQDTSRIQMRILDTLIQAGLREVMLVGDSYQAIYEWRQAEPQLFEEKFHAWQSNCTWLTENWRSTRSICDLACRLAASTDRIVARNAEVARFDHEPLLLGYDSEAELPALLSEFRQRCDALGIEGSSVSVLTRSRELTNAIVPGGVPQSQRSPWRDDDLVSRRVGRAKHLFDQGAFREALGELGRAAYTHLTGRNDSRREELAAFVASRGVARWKGELFRLLSALPNARGRLSDWLRDAGSVIGHAPFFTGMTLSIKQDRGANTYSDLTFGEVFGSGAVSQVQQEAVLGTVHSAKGKSLDAVFVALKSKGAIGPQYVNLLGSNLIDQEELRIVYVAVTRARKALAIAVPHASLARWRDFLLPPSSQAGVQEEGVG